MNKSFLVIISLLIGISVLADNLKLTGNIGGYAIEMIIDSVDNVSGEFTGEYRYLNQENTLQISGHILGDIIYIEENYLGNLTGVFYLEFDSGNITGVWLNSDSTLDYEVHLQVEFLDYSILKVKSLSDFNEECSDAISGTYKIDYYFINDYFVTEENLAYEIGYNGGLASFVIQEDSTLKFQIELVCGPTYHLAIAEGIAKKDGDSYVYENSEWSEEEPCLILFKFSDKGVYATANNSFGCGFGARAYMDHELIKVKDWIEE